MVLRKEFFLLQQSALPLLGLIPDHLTKGGSMDAILISFAICVLGVMVTVLIFGLAMRPESEEEEAAPSERVTAAEEQFFLSDVRALPNDSSGATNAVLLDLESHLRTEQEAAANFLQGPNPDSLHARSDSPFWH